MWFITAALYFTHLPVCMCLYSLTQISYLQLPTGITAGKAQHAGLNMNAAIDGAYDVSNNIIYVIGGQLLHIVDIADPGQPQLLFAKEFSTNEGHLKSVDVCGDELAVAMEAKVGVEPGLIMFYQTYTPGNNITEFNETWNITAGPSPVNIQYTSDCSKLIVPTSGEAGKDSRGVYKNPEGAVTIIDTKRRGYDGHANFTRFNYGQASYNAAVRVPSRYIPQTVLRETTTLSQDAAPDYVALMPDGATAWLTLPELNALAKLNTSDGQVLDLFPLPLKDWSSSPIDASDYDGGVHRRIYAGLFSLRQPGVIKPLSIGRKTFLITADEGAIRSYSKARHGFDWSEATRGKHLDIDSMHSELKANAANDERLGRLEVSRLEGKHFYNEQYSYLVAYGGRGFSIWDTDDVTSPVYDSGGILEAHMEAAYKSVFNSDYSSAFEEFDSPENLRDTVSDTLGAQVTALDVRDDNGVTFLVVGTSSTGTLYLFTVDKSSGQPKPVFETVYRSGQTDSPWRDLYLNATAGDLYITDLGIILSGDSPTHTTLVYVISKGSGSLSLYEINRV